MIKVLDKNLSNKNSSDLNESSLIYEEKDEIDIIPLCEIQLERWTQLIFCHKPASFLGKSEFLIIKDNEQIVKNIDYPNLKNQKIMSIGFFKDFTGQASTVMMSSETINSPQIFFELSKFKYGLYNEKNIRLFNNLFENPNNIINSNAKLQSEFKLFFNNLLCIYSPSRNINDKVKDILDNIDADINTNVENNILVGGIATNNNYQKNIEFLGGFNILLPIFDFFANNNLVNSTLVNEALTLILKILQNGELNIVNSIFNIF